MNENIPEVKIEKVVDEYGTMIMLTQDGDGNADRVCIHPLHLRFMAEQFGLVQTSDVATQRAITTLERRMVLLRDRVNHLGKWMAEHSDHDHADLSYEVTYLAATSDLANEFCADFSNSEPTTQTEQLELIIN